MRLEKPALPLPGPRRVLADFGGLYAANAVVAFLFACTGPVAIILQTGARGGLTEADLGSWVFAAFFLNGLISLALSLAYRQPLVFFWTIPGTVLVGPALSHLSFPEVIGAFLATGVLMLVLGLSGWVRRAMDVLPMPIVMAMVAGVFLRFGDFVDFLLQQYAQGRRGEGGHEDGGGQEAATVHQVADRDAGAGLGQVLRVGGEQRRMRAGLDDPVLRARGDPARGVCTIAPRGSGVLASVDQRPGRLLGDYPSRGRVSSEPRCHDVLQPRARQPVGSRRCCERSSPIDHRD